jgi:hypothetical protein
MRQPQYWPGQNDQPPPRPLFQGKSGAAYVTRTRDPRITNAVLYRLS